jgi:hypothetical protein
MLENGPEIDARQRKREDIGRLTMTNEVLIRHRFPDRSEQGETSPFFMTASRKRQTFTNSYFQGKKWKHHDPCNSMFKCTKENSISDTLLICSGSLLV